MFNAGLESRIAHGALYDSAERSDAPKCHPETRKAVRQDIFNWIQHGGHDNNPKRILWLSGPAGSGKTAIAGTIADECNREGLLAASFFFSGFSRSAKRRSKGSFILTLAYALALQKTIANLKDAILEAIAEDPAVLHKQLHCQLEILILNPLRTIAGQSDRSAGPEIIIVDGVDECAGTYDGSYRSKEDVRKSREENHREILSVLALACSDPSFPFRILIVSRPEPAISRFFQSSPGLTLRLFLDDKYNPDADIRLFLEERLSAIQRTSVFQLPSNWAPQDVIDLLVVRASGQFIYATTVLRFVENTSRPPQEQLQRVLEYHCGSDSNPFASLDALYTGILLEMTPDPPRAGMWLVCFSENWSYRRKTGGAICAPAWYKRAVLESFQGETAHLLAGLSSLVSIADVDGEFKVGFYHKSLLDSLGDAIRSGRLHVSQAGAERFIKDRHCYVLKSEFLIHTSFRLQHAYTNDDLDKGPDVGLLEDSNNARFLDQFFRMMPDYINACDDYEVGDVNWYLNQVRAIHGERDKYDSVRRLFVAIDVKVRTLY